MLRLLLLPLGALAIAVALFVCDGAGADAQPLTLPLRAAPKPLPFKAYSKEVWAEMQAARAAAKAGDHSAAAAHYGAALKLEPEPNSAWVDLHIMRGGEYLQSHAYAMAFADFDKAIMTGYPLGPSGDKGIRAFMGRGYSAVNLAKYAQAKDDFDVVLKELPHDVPRSSSTLAWRGAAFQGLGNRAQAVADYKASLVLDATNSYAKQALKELGEP